MPKYHQETVSVSKFAWTNEQAAALAASTDVLLTANAGTGKTLTIVGKIMWMLGLKTGHSESQKKIPLKLIYTIVF